MKKTLYKGIVILTLVFSVLFYPMSVSAKPAEGAINPDGDTVETTSTEEETTDTTDDNTNTNTTNTTSNETVEGVWNEDKIAKPNTLKEDNIETDINATERDGLDLEELESLDDWENNVNQQKVTIISILRKVVATVGIILVVWGLLLYLAYWVDTVNTLIPISFVVIFSLGKLEVLNEEETTWSLGGEENKGKRLTVNHKNICTICVLMIGVGVLILSGTVYFLIEKCFSIAKNILA